MTKSHLFLAAAVAAVAASAAFSHEAFADQFMNITFSGDTVGSQPATGVTSPVLTQPNSIGGYTSDADPNPFGESPPSAASGTILVGNATGMSKGAILTTKSDAQANGQLWLDTGFSQTSQQITLSFDFNVLNAPNNQTEQPKTLNTTGSTDMVFGLNAFTTDTATGQQSFRFAAAPTSNTGGVLAMRSPSNTNLVSFFNYTNGDTNHIEIDADYTTGTLNAFVNGTQDLTNFSFLSAGTLANATTAEFFSFINGQLGDSNQVAIDNIVASTPAPEPASLGILGVGVLALIGKRRRIL